ncbi:MAG TPA: hypothetical protein VE870_11200 [Bacteroidales bacterium]|nr:hypothetical protein [Bacteroidales bacterium]
MRRNALLIQIFVIACILFTLADFTTNAQVFRDYYNQEVRVMKEPDELSLSVNASTFFNNNEFFGTDVEGYTLTGAFLQPVVSYSLAENLSFGAGIHLLKYNGRDEFAQTLPLFRIDYKVSSNFGITMGSFNGGESFRLPEPMYTFENHFTSLVNNGIRLDFHGDRIRSLTWLNWEHFILPNDTLQEQLTVGSSNDFTLLKRNGSTLTIPAYLVVHHQGGQINITDKPVITTWNIGGGFLLSHSFSGEKHGEVFLNPLVFFNSNDESDTNGFAWYPQIGMRIDPFSLTAGYFHGRSFDTVYGEPLFFSPGQFMSGTSAEEVKSLLTFKAGFGKKITPSSSVLLRFEGYYDTMISKLQYTYGLHILINENFTLKAFERR